MRARFSRARFSSVTETSRKRKAARRCAACCDGSEQKILNLSVRVVWAGTLRHMRLVSLAALRSQLLSLPNSGQEQIQSRLNLLAIRPFVVKRHGSLTGRSNCEVERFAECEVRTASFAYKSKVVSNSLDKREDHFTGFRVVKRFVGDILNARCLSYSRA